MEAFERLYKVMARITDSTYGSVYECRRQGEGAGTISVVKIVRRKDHPLLGTTRSQLSGKRQRAASANTRLDHVETEEFWRYMWKLLGLKHPNVVQYLQFFADTSSFYFVMEKCPGRTLLDHLLVVNTWKETAVHPLMRQLLEGLQYIHGLGVLHRDIKLENLMILPAATGGEALKGSGHGVQLKILDFGLGCEAAAAYGTIGTLGYMAPEIFAAESHSCGVDIFAAGVVLHILFTGRPAFQPPMHVRSLEIHVQALTRGPDMQKHPLPIVSANGRDILDWMLLPKAAARCTAAEALRHPWLRSARCVGGGVESRWGGPREEPELWNGKSRSELQFLRVMGVWNGSSSASALGSVVAGRSLRCIEEAEIEEENFVEQVCFGIVQKMEVAVCIADPSREDCPIAAVSSGFEALTGYRGPDIVGKNCRFLNEPCAAEVPADARNQMRVAAKGDKTFLGVVPNMRADGNRFQNLLHLSPIDIQGRSFIVGVQMEVQGYELDFENHEILGAARKVHTAIRHWLRSPANVSGVKMQWSRSTSAPDKVGYDDGERGLRMLL